MASEGNLTGIVSHLGATLGACAWTWGVGGCPSLHCLSIGARHAVIFLAVRWQFQHFKRQMGKGLRMPFVSDQTQHPDSV